MDVATALRQHMENFEAFPSYTSYVWYISFQNITPMPFLFQMNGLSSFMSMRKVQKITYIYPSVLIFKLLLQFSHSASNLAHSRIPLSMVQINLALKQTLFEINI